MCVFLVDFMDRFGFFSVSNKYTHISCLITLRNENGITHRNRLCLFPHRTCVLNHTHLQAHRINFRHFSPTSSIYVIEFCLTKGIENIWCVVMDKTINSVLFSLSRSAVKLNRIPFLVRWKALSDYIPQ